MTSERCFINIPVVFNGASSQVANDPHNTQSSPNGNEHPPRYSIIDASPQVLHIPTVNKDTSLCYKMEYK